MKTFIATIAALMTLVAAPAFAEEPKAEAKAESKLGNSNVPCPGGSTLQAVGDKGDGKDAPVVKTPPSAGRGN